MKWVVTCVPRIWHIWKKKIPFGWGFWQWNEWEHVCLYLVLSWPTQWCVEVLCSHTASGHWCLPDWGPAILQLQNKTTTSLNCLYSIVELASGMSTSMKNGYSIVVLRIEKDPFSKDISSNFTPLLHENKKSELKFTPLFCKTRIFSEILHPFHVKTRRNQDLNLPHFSNQIKLKSNIFILNRYGHYCTMR